MAGHKRFSLATDIQVYYCDPQQPWQRGSIFDAYLHTGEVLVYDNGFDQAIGGGSIVIHTKKK